MEIEVQTVNKLNKNLLLTKMKEYKLNLNRIKIDLVSSF